MRGGRLALAALGVAALAWAAGFAWFVSATAAARAPPAHADGIVVLTGGAGRVTAALRLLAEDRAGVLLISGVNRAAEFAALARAAGVDPALAARVTLGREAADTRGNASETAAWAAERGLRTLLVVTAGYHMPRALAELGGAMPGVALYPIPVLPPATREGGTAARLRLLAEEYTKFLAAEAGLTRLAARAEERGG